MANKNDDTAAFVFLDQEKAFDRVNHEFLFKTMKAFGIGENFINWVKTIYSNASSYFIPKAGCETTHKNTRTLLSFTQ